jgi:hypothetical protein
MATPRWHHTSTLLGSGKVLVAGGNYDTVNPVASAELFDPSGTGSFAATGSMTTAHSSHTATLLGSGKVLIAGGYGSGADYLSSAERFDPGGLRRLLSTGSMATGRHTHTATLLGSGKVLVAGGLTSTSSYLSRAERFRLLATGGARSAASACQDTAATVCCDKPCAGYRAPLHGCQEGGDKPCRRHIAARCRLARINKRASAPEPLPKDRIVRRLRRLRAYARGTACGPSSGCSGGLVNLTMRQRRARNEQAARLTPFARMRLRLGLHVGQRRVAAACCDGASSAYRSISRRARRCARTRSARGAIASTRSAAKTPAPPRALQHGRRAGLDGVCGVVVRFRRMPAPSRRPQRAER